MNSKVCCVLGNIWNELVFILIVKKTGEVDSSTDSIRKHSFILLSKKKTSYNLPQVASSSPLAFSIAILSRIRLTSSKQEASMLTTHTASFSLNTYTHWPLVRGRA